MLSTSRSRIRALAVVGMAAVVITVSAVTYQASASELATSAPDGEHSAPDSEHSAPDGEHSAPDREHSAPDSEHSRLGTIPVIAATIKPPANSRPIGVYRVVWGTQNYTCVVPDGATSGAYTGASTPDAWLMGTGGAVHHFGGPSWQSQYDKSLVTAVKKAASAHAGTIPELLLQVDSHSGHGIMDKADYISRLATSGGVAPATSCASGDVTRVPYRAVYVFWDAPRAHRDAEPRS